MKAAEFQDWLVERLREAGHPGIAEVSTWHDEPHDRPLVRCTDGREIRLTVVSTSPPGSGERIERPAGTSIEVRQRGE